MSMMLSKMDRDQIRQLLQSQQGNLIQIVADALCVKIKDETTNRETEWDMIKNVLDNEGQIKGIKRMIAELYTQATQTDD